MSTASGDAVARQCDQYDKNPTKRAILMSDERLSRMKTKLDKRSAAVVVMARLEQHLLFMTIAVQSATISLLPCAYMQPIFLTCSIKASRLFRIFSMGNARSFMAKSLRAKPQSNKDSKSLFQMMCLMHLVT